MLGKWLERWKNWVGDRDMESAIRAQLRDQGYQSARSQITNFKLVAIERPGWVCIYEFGVETWDASTTGVTLFGVARDDARRRTTVQLHERPEPRDEQRAIWSEGLILAPHLRL